MKPMKPMKTRYHYHERPVFNHRDHTNLRVIAANFSRYFDGTGDPRPVHLPPGVSLRSYEPDPALLGVNPNLADCR